MLIMRLLIALISYVIFVGAVLFIDNNTGDQTVYAGNNAPSAVLSAVSQESRLYIDVINKTRISYGVEPLIFSPDLESIADMRVAEMSKSYHYSHTRQDGSNFVLLLPQEQKQKYACENLQLQSSDSVEESIRAWMGSTAHRECLLNESITFAGLSHAQFGNNLSAQEQHVVFAFIGTR